MKNLGISILMFILLVAFAFSIDVMRGLDAKEALQNMRSSFRVLGKGEFLIYIGLFISLLGNVMWSLFQNKKKKKQPSQKESSK